MSWQFNQIYTFCRANSTVAADKWVKWPSKRRRIGLTSTLYTNFWNQSRNIDVVIQPFSITPWYVFLRDSFSNHVDCRNLHLKIIWGFIGSPLEHHTARTIVFSLLVPWVTWKHFFPKNKMKNFGVYIFMKGSDNYAMPKL